MDLESLQGQSSGAEVCGAAPDLRESNKDQNLALGITLPIHQSIFMFLLSPAFLHSWRVFLLTYLDYKICSNHLILVLFSEEGELIAGFHYRSDSVLWLGLSKNPNLMGSHCWASHYSHEILQKFHFTQIFHWETKKVNYSVREESSFVWKLHFQQQHPCVCVRWTWHYPSKHE